MSRSIVCNLQLAVVLLFLFSYHYQTGSLNELCVITLALSLSAKSSSSIVLYSYLGNKDSIELRTRAFALIGKDNILKECEEPISVDLALRFRKISRMGTAISSSSSYVLVLICIAAIDDSSSTIRHATILLSTYVPHVLYNLAKSFMLYPYSTFKR
ncbi:hypothetical protein HN588_03380 [Candidatus Bathyarchaeota archaeon]|nr:hypothetical protein [Candidatus Bathyarchaeota archaeon]